MTTLPAIGEWVCDDPHSRVHQGAMWHCSVLASSVADGASLDMVITAPAGDFPHMTLEAACGGSAELQFYEGTISSSGTVETIYNHKRTSSATWAGDIRTNPTILSSNLGTLLTVQYMPGGSKSQAVGSGQTFDLEWIIRNDVSYLLRLTNRSGSTQRASIGCNHYSCPRLADA